MADNLKSQDLADIWDAAESLSEKYAEKKADVPAENAPPSDISDALKEQKRQNRRLERHWIISSCLMFGIALGWGYLTYNRYKEGIAVAEKKIDAANDAAKKNYEAAESWNKKADDLAVKSGLLEKENSDLKQKLAQTTDNARKVSELSDRIQTLEKENSEYKKLPSPSPDDLVSANIDGSSETLFRNEYKAYDSMDGPAGRSVQVNIRDNHIVSFELTASSDECKLKKMPWEILDLAYLQKLDISYHSLTYIDGVDSLTQLAELNLCKNKIGRISGLDKLSKLGYLYLNDNVVVKIEGLDNLTQLKYLDLSKNQIVKIEGLGNLAQLKKLGLDGNKIKRLEGFDNLKELKEISIQDNPIDYKDATTKKTLADLERRGVAVYRDE